MTTHKPTAVSLLPCPFCGDQPIAHQNDLAHNLWRYRCENCDAGPHGAIGKHAAAEAWNRRSHIQAEPVGFCSKKAVERLTRSKSSRGAAIVSKSTDVWNVPLYPTPPAPADRDSVIEEEDRQLLDQLIRENVAINPARTVVTSDKAIAQAMRLSERGLVGVEQLGCGLRLSPTRLAYRTLKRPEEKES